MVFNNNPYDYPIIVDWFEFQNILSGGPAAPPPDQPIPVHLRGRPVDQHETAIRQIMELKRINDCVIYPLPSLRREYLFSMKQEPNFFLNSKGSMNIGMCFVCFMRTKMTKCTTIWELFSTPIRLVDTFTNTIELTFRPDYFQSKLIDNCIHI